MQESPIPDGTPVPVIASEGGSPPTDGPDHRESVLVQVTGRDHPGITSGLLSVLDAAGAEVEDIEQVVIRGRLSLGLVVTVPGGRDLLKELLLYGWESDVTIDFEVVEQASPGPKPSGHVVTVLGERLGPGDLGVVAETIAAAGGNIERIVRLSRHPVWSYELLVRGGEAESLRSVLLKACSKHPTFEVAIAREGLARRSQRLVVIDVDSTLITEEVVDLVAHEAGVGDEVSELTERAMAGEMDFEESLVRRVGLLAGADAGLLDQIAEKVSLTPGARTFFRTLHRLGYTTAIVSGGFLQVVERLQERLDIGHAHANELEVVDGRLTGRIVGEVVDRAGKAELLRKIAEREGVPLEQVVAVGDGANDLDMLDAAGLGVAFNARPLVRAAADASVSVPYLDAILFLLGVSREEIEEADRLDG
ncbi:MAG: phosphoserine phosphatase SerB [Acidimicrobiales bacterium]|jgi:phosphoserine phosphatase|nr:phosphoserine phosphatase SerB [Acidimicrobiales bacterium]|tara:strand:- start:7561 stop:8823 length:1263 start_codon:yes stop_codon:yes gene_type:complete